MFHRCVPKKAKYLIPKEVVCLSGWINLLSCLNWYGMMDLENKSDKYLGPISFKILYISTAMILTDEILNESNSLLHNKVS